MKVYILPPVYYHLVAKLAKFFACGAIIVVPTETCYGLAVDYKNEEAVKRLYRIKSRPQKMQLPVLVSSLEQAKEVANLDRKQEQWLTKHLPNSFSVIVPTKSGYPHNEPTVALRFSTNGFLNALAQQFGPLALTSANIHDYGETYSIEAASTQFNKQIFQPDIYIDAGDLAQIAPTTIIDLTAKRPSIVRKGLFELK